jgi:hypothetical protein
MEKHLMPTASKKNDKSGKKPAAAKKGQRNGFPDLSKDPFFVRKHKDAVAFMKKAGMPKEFTTKKK